MKLRRWIILILLSLWLTACGSPFAPVVLAPSTVEVIDSPDELPPAVRQRTIVWFSGFINISVPQDTLGFPLSNGWRYEGISYIYYNAAFPDGHITTHISDIVDTGDGLPRISDTKLYLLNADSGQKLELVSKKNSFPHAISLAAPVFTPDGKGIVFWVGWEHETDLAVVDIKTGVVKRLNVDVTVTNFGMPDVSTDGHIVVICQGPDQQQPSSELCLLDNNGKFIRYLTAEGYPWPGYGRFTPGGQYVVYESRFRLYKVRIDGGDRQQIAPCSALFGPQLVTEDYAVTACYISQEPDCYALFVASLDGRDFRRIGYIEPYCVSGE